MYRLLLAGPGDDAEGIDAGELECYSDEASRRAADLAAGTGSGPAGGASGGRKPASGITPALWPEPADGDGRAAAREVPAGTAGPGGLALAAAVPFRLARGIR